MPFKRDLFSGDLIETPSEGGGRHIIARIDPPPGSVVRKNGSLWGRPWKSLMKGCQIENMDEYNKTAVPGARYVPSQKYPGLAELHCDSRRARANELAFRQEVDLDGGYGDMPRTTRRRKRAVKLEPYEKLREYFDSHKNVRTHFPGCYKWHPECVAHLLLPVIDRLEGELASKKTKKK